MSTTSIPTELPRHGETKREAASRIFDALADPDLQAVCAFVATGLLLTACLARAFPTIGDVISLVGQLS